MLFDVLDAENVGRVWIEDIENQGQFKVMSTRLDG
jgi:hypothetical protein